MGGQSNELKQQFSGDIIGPGDADYEMAGHTLFSQGKPALVVRPQRAADVIAAVQYAKRHRLVLSVRSGGHSAAGFGTNQGGLVIDLMHFNDVNPVAGSSTLVRVGAGAHWMDVGSALQAQGLALSSGDTRTVGVGGLTLGGGIGWMVRAYGLTIDSLVRAEIVTAAGEILHASVHENPELFWGLRGGGGNFGIVTQFEFAAHPIREVIGGQIVYTLDNVATLVRGWRDHMRTAEEKLTTILLLLPSFMGNPPAATLLCCYAGDDETAANIALEPLKQLGSLVHEDIQRKAYVAMLEDAHVPQGTHIISKNGFAAQISDELIQAIAGEYTSKGGPILQIRSLGGAMNRIAPDATAFAHRDKEALLVMPLFVPPGAQPDVIAAAAEPWQKLMPFLSGCYSNLAGGNNDEDILSIYPQATYDRLAVLKRQYDPDNLFNQNFNIKAG